MSVSGVRVKIFYTLFEKLFVLISNIFKLFLELELRYQKPFSFRQMTALHHTTDYKPACPCKVITRPHFFLHPISSHTDDFEGCGGE